MENAKTPRRLLAETVDAKGGRKRFMELTGLTKQYLSQLLSGSKPFGAGARQRIEKALGLPLGYYSGADPALTPFTGGISSVPLMTWQNAGICEAPDDAKTVTVPMSVSDRAIALVMESDSMLAPSSAERSIPPGSTIIVDPEIPAKAGDLVVARLPGAPSATCRKLIEDSGQLYLAALNPRFSELIKVTPEIKLIGRVMGAFSAF